MANEIMSNIESKTAETMIALSVENIIKEIAALSALRSFLADGENPVAMLTADNREALMPIVVGAVATIGASFGPAVALIDSGEPQGSELMRLTVELGGEIPEGRVTLMRRALETAVVNRCLGEIWPGIDRLVSAHFFDKSEAAVTDCADLLAVADAKLHGLRANY